MCIVSEELKQLYLNNAPRLVGWYIKRHKDFGIYFDSFEDMRQELLLSVWEKLPFYDETIGKFSTYVVVICGSEVSHKISYASRGKRNGSLKRISLNTELADGFSLMDTIAGDDDPCNTLCQKERDDKLRKLLNPLTYAFYIDGYKLKEIAKIENKTQGAVRYAIRKNLIKVKKALEEEKNKYESNELL